MCVYPLKDLTQTQIQNLQLTQQCVWSHCAQMLLPNCGRTSPSIPAQPQQWNNEFLHYCITKDWEFWGGNPSCCCSNSKTGDYIPKHKAKCTTKFCIIFMAKFFDLFGAVKKPLKRTITHIYKLDRKRLCIHSLTNHLS